MHADAHAHTCLIIVLVMIQAQSRQLIADRKAQLDAHHDAVDSSSSGISTK
jgi:hypothetical protein